MERTKEEILEQISTIIEENINVGGGNTANMEKGVVNVNIEPELG